jgi:hypothetical protein
MRPYNTQICFKLQGIFIADAFLSRKRGGWEGERSGERKEKEAG